MSLIGPLELNFCEISVQIHTFSFNKMHLKNVICKMLAILAQLQYVNMRSNISYMYPGLTHVVCVQNDSLSGTWMLICFQDILSNV